MPKKKKTKLKNRVLKNEEKKFPEPVIIQLLEKKRLTQIMYGRYRLLVEVCDHWAVRVQATDNVHCLKNGEVECVTK